MDISTILLAKPEYTADNTVNLTVAVTFDKNIKSKDVQLTLRKADDGPEITLQGEFKDGVSAYTPDKKKTRQHLHFKLDGLEPGQAYTYQLSNNGNPISVLPAIGEAEGHLFQPQTFQAPPLPSQQAQYDFFVSADQEILDFMQRIKADDWIAKKLDLGFDHGEVTTQIYKRIEERRPNAFLHLGDVYHGEGIDKHIEVKRLKAFEAALKEDFDRVVRDRLAGVVSANLRDDHDYGHNDSDKAYFDAHPKRLLHATAAFAARWPVPTLGEDHHQGNYYQLDYGDVSVWCLNNRVYKTEEGLLGQEQTDWFRRTLSESKASVKIIATPLPFVAGKKPGDDYRGNPVEWDTLLKFFAEQNVTAIFAADSHNYSRTDLVIGLADRIVTIPQYIVGTLGGIPQKMSDEEIKALPAPLLPKEIPRQDYEGSEVKAYYTPMPHISPNPVNHKDEQRAFKDGKWIGKEVEKGAFGGLDVHIDLEHGSLITHLFLMKSDAKQKKPIFIDNAVYPLVPHSTPRMKV